MLSSFFPSHFNRGHSVIVITAVLALLCTAFIKLSVGQSESRWFEAIYILLFLVALKQNWQVLSKHWLLKFWGLAIFAPLVFFAINYWVDAEAAQKYSDFERLARIYFFIPVAWWLGGHARSIGVFLTALFLGLLGACLLDPNLSQTLSSLFQGRRVDFDVLNAQHVALFFTVALVGFLSAVPSLIQYSGRYIKIAGLAVFVGSLICVAVIYGTQTRAAYIAIFVTALVWGVLALVTWFKTRQGISGLAFAKWGVVVLVLFAVLANVFSSVVFDRFKRESGTLEKIVTLDLDNIPYTSIGIRVNYWIDAAHWIADKPLIGYGGKVRKAVVEASDHPENIKRNFGHFHNAYIEFLLGYGFLGLIIAISPMLWALWVSAARRTFAQRFAWYATLIFLVMCVFESYLFFWMGPFVLVAILSPLVSERFSLMLKPAK